MRRRKRPAPVEEPRLSAEQAKALLASVDVEVFPGVKDKRTVFDRAKCDHCGGLHARNCPAVQEIEYHTDGKVKRVRFWPDGRWPADEVLWLADVQEAAAEDGEDQ